MTSRRTQTLAWALAVAGVVVCSAGAAASIAFAAPASFLLIYVVGALMAVLGSLVAAREPHNPIGWLMCGLAFAASLVHLPTAYGYMALVLDPGRWPLGSQAVWFASWGFVAVIVFLPLISVRFPDGNVQRPWAVAEWLTLAGAVVFAAGIALSPTEWLVTFLSIPGTRVRELAPLVHGPLPPSLSESQLALVRSVGITGVLAGYVGSALAVIARFRGATGDQRLKLKWFAYAGCLVAATFLYGAVAWIALRQPLYLAFTPLEFAAVTLPLAIGIAILRYRLYDIDILINRTLVYGSATAVLAALYSAVVTLLNRLFISASGQRSDAAYVLTAFVVVVAFAPIRDWLQRLVDEWFPHSTPSQVLDRFRAGVESVVTVMDVERIGREFVDRAMSAFDARGAALYLGSESLPAYTRGDWDRTKVGIEVTCRHRGDEVARLVLAERRGAHEYTAADRGALERSAASVAEAIVLASELARGRSLVAR